MEHFTLLWFKTVLGSRYLFSPAPGSWPQLSLNKALLQAPENRLFILLALSPALSKKTRLPAQGAIFHLIGIKEVKIF